jgi:hypothetical protein
VRLFKVIVGLREVWWWRMALWYFQNIFGFSLSDDSIFARYNLCLALIACLIC